MKLRLALAFLPLLLGACANDHTSHTAYAPTRSPSETLRSRPANVYVPAGDRTARLNYPRTGQHRSYGIVEVASNAYTPTAEMPPPIAEYDHSFEEAYIQPATHLVTTEPFLAPRTFIRTDGTVAMGSYRVTPLGPQGTNRAVINQITGLPVDR